jgi:hypothetical protein
MRIHFGRAHHRRQTFRPEAASFFESNRLCSIGDLFVRTGSTGAWDAMDTLLFMWYVPSRFQIRLLHCRGIITETLR